MHRLDFSFQFLPAESSTKTKQKRGICLQYEQKRNTKAKTRGAFRINSTWLMSQVVLCIYPPPLHLITRNSTWCVVHFCADDLLFTRATCSLSLSLSVWCNLCARHRRIPSPPPFRKLECSKLSCKNV